MKGDFSRLTFDPKKDYTGVLMQQGRVLLDADWNEQLAGQLSRHRQLVQDLIGWHGTSDHTGFTTDFTANGNALNVTVGAGHYYVDGVRLYTRNPRVIVVSPLPEGEQVVYLEVWERVVTPIEDETIKEVALDGADTAVRRKIEWQLQMLKAEERAGIAFLDAVQCRELFARWVHAIPQDEDGQLAVRSSPTTETSGSAVCEQGDNGSQPQNQLFRVEIHDPGEPWSGSKPVPSPEKKPLTFKWSRDNGAVIYPIDVENSEGSLIQLPRTIRNASRLVSGRWVEVIVDPAQIGGKLVQIERFDPDTFQLTVVGSLGNLNSGKPFLRLWDQVAAADTPQYEPREEGFSLILSNGGALAVAAETPGSGNAKLYVWLKLADGIEIRFSPGKYLSGDYWLIPIRANQSIDESPRPPDGIERHYAPLAQYIPSGTPTPYRRCFSKRATPDCSVTKEECPTLTLGGEGTGGSGATPAGPATEGAAPAAAEPTDSPPVPPTPADPAPVQPTAIDPNARWEPDLIAPEYQDAVRSLFVSTRDVTRQIPARCLSCEPESAALRRWLGSALVSEITGLGCDQFLKRVHDLAIDEEDRESLRRDARTVWRMAKRLESNIAAAPHWKLKQEVVA